MNRFMNLVNTLMGRNNRIEVLEDRLVNLERDVFFLEKQLHYWHHDHHAIKVELTKKISYQEFDKFERHIARLEQIFA